VPPPWPIESWEATKGEVSSVRRWSVVASPAGLEPKSDCAGEGRQPLWAADPSCRLERVRPTSACSRLSDRGRCKIVDPR
jgi:hypothetical protein